MADLGTTVAVVATRVFSEEELERLRGFGEITREELVRFFRWFRGGCCRNPSLVHESGVAPVGVRPPTPKLRAPTGPYTPGRVDPQAQ